MTIVGETQTRTVAKMMSYRSIIVFVTFLASSLFGATLNEAILNALISIPIGIISYYLHERAWLLFSWARFSGFDTNLRSTVKTITYRIFAFVIVFIVGRLTFAEENSTAALYTIALFVVNFVIFYIIERVFNKIEWGKIYK